MRRFCSTPGAEILLETGRFWASRAQPEADGLCHIRGVIGPDEYHEHIDDNAFTNVMARWTIRRAIDVAALLREAMAGSLGAPCRSRLKLDEAELKQWRVVADTIATGLDPKTGLFEQFAGYFALEDIDLALYAGRSVPMDVVLGRERTQRSQVVKQADVVALLGLLPEEFAGTSVGDELPLLRSALQPRQFAEPRHARARGRTPWRDRCGAPHYFLETADIDLSDAKVAIDGGVHIAALGGIWMMAVFGFAGLSVRSDGVVDRSAIAAELAQPCRSAMQWRRRHLKVRIEQARALIEVRLESGEPMTIFIGGEPYELRRGNPVRECAEAAHQLSVHRRRIFAATVPRRCIAPGETARAAPRRCSTLAPSQISRAGCWMARAKEKARDQGNGAARAGERLFIAFKRADASFADWPPDRKAMPGTAAGTAFNRQRTVASADLCPRFPAADSSIREGPCWA